VDTPAPDQRDSSSYYRRQQTPTDPGIHLCRDSGVARAAQGTEIKNGRRNPRQSSAGDFRSETPEIRQRYWLMWESGSNATSLPPTEPTIVLRLPTTMPPFGAVIVAGSEPTPALTVIALLEVLLL